MPAELYINFVSWNATLWLPLHMATSLLTPLYSGQMEQKLLKSVIFKFKEPFNTVTLLIEPDLCGQLVTQ